MMIKHIIFDFDGTLVNSKAVFISIYNQIADRYDLRRMEYSDIDILKRMNIIERCKYLGFPFYKITFLANEFYNLYRSSLKNILLVEEIRDILGELSKRGYSLSILSSNSQDNIRNFLQLNDIFYFSHISCSRKIFGKHYLIKKFLKEHKLKSSEVIYIGDEQRDIIACKKCEVKIIWVSWGYDHLEVAIQEDPDYIVNSPPEILNFI